MRRTMIAAGTLVLALAGNAEGQEAAAETDEVGQLDEILVTDGLTPIEQEKSGRAFTVITGKQLEQNQIRYVADALRLVPGFSVSRSGSFGGFTQVRVRGAEANQLLVMVDGVDVGETSSGEFDFGSLVADDIDRIEILRGPQSTFWGANALAGVVNIITKRGERNDSQGSARSEIGTDGTWLGGVSLSGGGENFDAAFAGVFRNTGGFNISDYGTEKDGDRNATLNGRFAADLSPTLTVDGTLRYVDRKSDVDPQDYSWGSPTYGEVIDGPDSTATQEFFGSLGATHVSFDGALTQKMRFAGSDAHREDFSGGLTTWNDGNRYNGTYQASYSFDTSAMLDAKHQLTGGYEWEQETFAPSHLSETFKRNTNSFVGEYRGEFLDRFDLNAGVRYDINDRFGDATTYSLSGAWRVTPATRLHSSVGTGVTSPTFFEQFGYVPDNFVGNPDLVPEESLGWDVGIEQGFFGGALVTDVTYFNQDLSNEIALVYGGPPTYPSTPINRSGKSKREGVEVAATVNLFNGFTAAATYTYTSSSEQADAGGPRLTEVRRPEHSGSLAAAYVFHEKRARVFGELVYNGTMEDFDYRGTLPSRVALPAYAVVNLGGSFRFTDHIEAYGRVDNLFDEDYEEVFGYNTQGRTAFFGLRGTF
ncbi:TonB-dependent receptor plug domain-containing protein [Mesorhizobium sp. L-8-3]|uniref:TonB-dependent receptor plug domain-containing protein n=1 Tax=Mesorhizobium sp. L-8-3 TaxID=2744522 RepID=UPI001926014F|nr:TonB-dependent receptor [Mesorhizobium sp. L-8-3]